MDSPAIDRRTDATGRSGIPGVLVPPQWVEERLKNGDLRPVDLRARATYLSGHIPGAVQLDLHELCGSDEILDNVLSDAAAFEASMRRLGISPDTMVVAYDDQWGLAAARLLWALHFYGHDSVAVLDGGWDRWKEERRPETDLPPTQVTGGFVATACTDVAATREWIERHFADPDVALIDTRTGAEYEQGHLPGARCWDWFEAVPVDSWDAVRDPLDLRREWGEMGVTPSREVVVYCRSGMRAAHTYMALKHAGYPRVRVYDGSWQEWSMHGGQRPHGAPDAT